MPDRSSVLDPRPAQTDKRMAHLDANAFLRPDNHPRPSRSVWNRPPDAEVFTLRSPDPHHNVWTHFFSLVYVRCSFCGAVLHCCIYAWSVLNHPIDLAVYGVAKKGRAVNAFYIAMGVFGTTAAILGPTIEPLGIHYKAIAGIYIGYGIITAIGLGMCYTSPVSTLQKWFPDYRDTAAGFAVAGSGAGSVVWSKAYLPTIDAVGRPPVDARLAREGMEEKLSTASKAVQTPTGADKPETVAAPKSPIKPLTLKQAVFTSDYIFMYLMFFANQLLSPTCSAPTTSAPCTALFSPSLAFGAVVGGITFNNTYNGKVADGMSVAEAYID
ncbi:hypothetical protein PI125_g4165 [Phytophthora idaei]|nr:hypothetical protein PI125_g4165 [Phytophthora idaei]